MIEEEYTKLKELKLLDKKIDSITNNMAQIGNSCFEIYDNRIIIHHNPEYERLRDIMYEMTEECNKKIEDFLIKYAEVVPVQIVGNARPTIKGKKIYYRILIKVLWDLRQPYENFKNIPDIMS